MASILDFLSTEKGKEFVQKSSEEVNESPEKVKSVLGMALPMLMGGLKKNASSPEGAEKLNSELQKEKHDGSILDSLGSGGISGLIGEGGGIVSHIFGGGESKIASAVSSATGMESSKVMKLIKMAAPVIMGLLGKQKRKDNVGQGRISGLVGSLMGSNTDHDQSMLESFMDSKGDGNFKDDVAGKLFGGKGKKGLGGLF